MTMPRKRERVVPAGVFKAKCLALLDRVAQGHETLIVTKHGQPVARVVPVAEVKPGSMLGSVLREDDLVAPLGEEWNADR